MYLSQQGVCPRNVTATKTREVEILDCAPGREQKMKKIAMAIQSNSPKNSWTKTKNIQKHLHCIIGYI